MSLRLNLLRSAWSSPSSRIRVISTTSPRRAEHGEHHAPPADDSTYNTRESFFSPAWRNTLILVTLGTLAYPYLPSTSTTSSSPTLLPDKLASERTDPSTPYITRLLARAIPDASHWAERNDRHLELTKEAAEGTLLIQDAERPKIRRLGTPRPLQEGSPHGVPVGS